MANRLVVQAGTAFSASKKRSILMEEGQRRLKNCSPELDWEKKTVFLNRFSSDMKLSGHTPSFRGIVLKRVILKYENDLSNHTEGKKMMYRSQEERLKQKEVEKQSSSKDGWFRSDGATSTLTVPSTPNGALAEKVRENLSRGRQPAGTRTKVIESGGVLTNAGILKSNQFPITNCLRADCVLCFQKDGEKPTTCQVNGIGYQGQCSRCPDKTMYVGESSKTGYTRMKQHFMNYKTASEDKLPALPEENERDPKSWMWEHVREMHDGVVGVNEGKGDFEMSVTGVFRKCLERQVFEGVRIQKCEDEGGSLLNSKKEFFTSKHVQTMFKQW